MSFASIAFFVFFTGVAALMSLTNIKKLSGKPYIAPLRQSILLAASYLFYGWWDWRFCLLMLFMTAAAYVCALQTEKTKKSVYAVIGAAVPLVILGFFKYYNFFAASFASAFGIQHINALNIVLPVGISFYTFQSLSYTIDVFQHKIQAEKSFRKLALYIAFFPQLVAGPIIKAADFLPQLDENRNISLRNFTAGIQIFMFGLFKKIVFADWLSVFVDDIFRTPKAFHALSLILGVIAYSIQIYFDFSGYSDMATGCAKCLGYDFARNFNLPYLSPNISEFWKRWHISLSSWLKEYLYIPLGGSRKGTLRTYINLMLTMLLGGLWHGAAWTFVVWGMLHGAALWVHKFYAKHFAKQKSKPPIPPAVSILVTNVFIAFCWIFFRAGSFTEAWEILYGIVTWQDGIVQLYVWVFAALIMVCAGAYAAFIKKQKNERICGFYPVLDLSSFWGLVLFFVELGLIAGLAYTGANPFIYFQF